MSLQIEKGVRGLMIVDRSLGDYPNFRPFPSLSWALILFSTPMKPLTIPPVKDHPVYLDGPEFHGYNLEFRYKD